MLSDLCLIQQRESDPFIQLISFSFSPHVRVLPNRGQLAVTMAIESGRQLLLPCPGLVEALTRLESKLGEQFLKLGEVDFLAQGR